MKKAFALFLAVLFVALCTPVCFAEPEFSYERYNSGDGIKITKYNGPGGAVEIPSEIDNLPVIGIGACAFKGAHVTSLTIPDSCKDASIDVFIGCNTLESVKIGKNFNCQAPIFLNQYSLKSIVVSPENPYLASNGVMLYHKEYGRLISYACGAPEKKFTIPSYIKTVGLFSFYGSRNLEEVVCPENVTTLQEASFQNCPNLKAIYVENSQAEIHGYTVYEDSSAIVYTDSTKFFEERLFTVKPLTTTAPATTTSTTTTTAATTAPTTTTIAATKAPVTSKPLATTEAPATTASITTTAEPPIIEEAAATIAPSETTEPITTEAAEQNKADKEAVENSSHGKEIAIVIACVAAAALLAGILIFIMKKVKKIK